MMHDLLLFFHVYTFQAQHERADNSTLRSENDKIQCENLAIREALKNVICPSCGGPPFGEEERQRSLQKLQIENAQLKEEACFNCRKSNNYHIYIIAQNPYIRVELGFLFGRPNSYTNILVKSQNKPSYTCVNIYTYTNLNILILELVIIYKYIVYKTINH